MGINNHKTPENKNQLEGEENTKEHTHHKKPVIQKTELPDDLKSGVESLSGFTMDDVKIHYNSNKPTQLNAHDYEQGASIHLGHKQQKHLPNETWHVVQQNKGRISATVKTEENINTNDDATLEKEADTMGQKVVEGKSSL